MRKKKRYSKYNSYQNNTQRNSGYSFKGRAFFIYFCFFPLVLVLLCRLYALQIRDYSEFSAQAESLHETTAILTPQRGLIYCQDKNKEYIPLAINKKYFSLYIVPKEIKDPKEVSEVLAQIIPLPYEEIFEKASKAEDPYELLLKKIEDESLISQIKEQNLQGVYFKEEHYRYYPFDSLAAQTIGFVAESDDGLLKGRYGLEAYYNDILTGQKGVFQGVKDALGRLVRSSPSQEKKQVEGVSIITTIDKNVQFTAEQSLKDLITTRKASKGTIIVMEAKTGKILALANWPTFNLNNFSEITDYSTFRNYATEERYEPGSVIKPFTMFAGIDSGKVTPDTTYVDKGYYEVGGYRLENYRGDVYGKSTMRKVLEFSINTGAIFVAQQVGSETLRNYFTKFGLGEITGIDLPNEIAGDLSNLEYPKINPTYFATASYGEGISVTPMGLIRAYAILA
ncbi:MAG: penicillin-binding protein 2, partial [Candidatus Pacebacteria bacterium]|nr:penicillin-binding protein 2 [Candidatus Paceibacterota bacterium]